MKSLFTKIFFSIFLLMSALADAYGQTDTSKATQYESLSLKDLLSVKIGSVSKKTEFLFDAPLSASVLTKEEIRKAGCTSIMEALRLVPGMIVRELTNGNYDIHLRGMDNVPPNISFDITSNTTTLVMIDNRPIYSYLRGGTFWETLPVDLNDVERIEVVRGPAGALYGPNAVNGVINIITRQSQKEGLYLVANSRMGSNHTFVNNASIGYRANRWSAIASGNYQGRDRSQKSYFEYYRNQYFEQPDFNLTMFGDTSYEETQRSPRPGLAMEKYAANVFLNYTVSDEIKFNMSAGAQHSIVQKISAENAVTPLSTAGSDSRYADFSAKIKGLSAQVSYNDGTQFMENVPGNKYDFQTFDANIEYNFTKGDFSLKPGLSYRNVIYDDTKYSDTINNEGLFNARGKIITQTASLRSEYSLFDKKLRLIAAVALNKFNYPSETYASYQFGATYKLNKNNLIRAVYSQTPRSSAVYDTYVNQTLAIFPIGFKKFHEVRLEGNKMIKLLTAKMFEIGYRAILSPYLTIDVELFRVNGKNFSSLIQNGPYTRMQGTDTIIVAPVSITNIPLTLLQQGITVSLTYNVKNLQVKPFVTIQDTRMNNYAPFTNTSDAIRVPGQDNPLQNNINSAIGAKETFKGTPPVFGGADINYLLAPKVNLNMNIYYYSRQTYKHVTNILINDGVRGIYDIKAKLIINANLSYEPAKGLFIFCTAKNILNDRSVEFYRTDRVPFMLLAGLNYEF